MSKCTCTNKTEGGTLSGSSNDKHSLVNKEPEYYVYINVYERDLDGLIGGSFSTSSACADVIAGPGRVGRMKVKLEARFDD